MRRFVTDAQGEIVDAETRSEVIGKVSTTSFHPIDVGPSLRSPVGMTEDLLLMTVPLLGTSAYESAPMNALSAHKNGITVTPSNQIIKEPSEPQPGLSIDMD
jgi:hypothetical protein